MKLTRLLEEALGITLPWEVVGTKFDLDNKRLDIFLDFPKGSRFPCPECGSPSLFQTAKAKARGYRSAGKRRTVIYLLLGKLQFNLPNPLPTWNVKEPTFSCVRVYVDFHGYTVIFWAELVSERKTFRLVFEILEFFPSNTLAKIGDLWYTLNARSEPGLPDCGLSYLAEIICILTRNYMTGKPYEPKPRETPQETPRPGPRGHPAQTLLHPGRTELHLSGTKVS